MPTKTRQFTNVKQIPKNYTGIAVISMFEGVSHKEWYRNGERHRADGPAIVHSDGSQSWYRHGKLHRVKGPAVDYVDGTKEWYLNGKLHRVDGPAVERNKTNPYLRNIEEWWFDGYRHRIDGPAVIRKDGMAEWWWHYQFVYRRNIKHEYIVIQDGLPSHFKWDRENITQKKILTAEGFAFIPNLPGI